MRKSVRLLAGVIVTLGLVLPATAEAQTACTWQRTELPLPPGHSMPEVRGIGGDYAVGQINSPAPGIVRWHNGAATLIGLPTTEPDFFGAPIDVGADGTVLAALTPLTAPGAGRPYVTKPDGTHKFLADPAAGWAGTAVAINGRGDVVGYASGPEGVRIALWTGPDYGPPRLFGNTVPAGIDDSGVIVTRYGARYVTPGFAWPLAKPAGATGVYVQSYDNGLAVGWTTFNGGDHLLLWNPDGSLRYSLPDGLGYSANAQGTVLGTVSGSFDAHLWRAGLRVPLPDPSPLYYSTFVTGRDTLVGTYIENSTLRAAEWSCG
ncbi:hypothetical protein GC106_63460 [Kibdelosporangium sp. 4NS15]|uniref:Extracellular repeat, HAF family n=1 Tax=Kibdelosporangium persicum TaxID=2698649 RepID=A0ABX2FEC5_9PSEU|nr:hypothetical protein [Kibdelosporangium persicum]